MSILRIALPILLAAISCPAAPLPKERIRESEQRQEQIGAEAKQLVGALDVMLGEYSRNHLAGDDVQTVQRLRGSLDQLTVEEMRQVVDLLQAARAVRDEGAAVKTVADAYSAQRQIIVTINRILAEHARNQQAREIALQLNDLADRQARNLQNGIELGRMSAGEKPDNFEAVLQAQLETQRGEQAAISEELKLARERLGKFAADKQNADVAAKFKEGAQQLQKVEPQAMNAAEALKSGQLFKAVSDEKTSRDELRKVARQIAPRERGAEALRQAEQEVGRMIRDQEQLSAETGKQKADEDFNKWIADKMAEIDPNKTMEGKFRRMSPEERKQSKELRAKFDQEQLAKGAQLAKLEDQQGEIAAKSDALGSDLAEVQQAAKSLRDAAAKMQEARSAMLEANAPQAQKQQDQALAQLGAAQAELRKKAEEAEMLAGHSGDKLKDLERLQQAAQELAKQEKAMAATPDAAKQGELARRAEQVAQRAAELAPKAEQALQAGANEAKKSEQALQANNPQQGKQNAQQAAQNFEKAAQQIAQEMANAQVAQQQMQQAMQALAELAKIIEGEQKVMLDTTKAEALMRQKKPANFREIAPQQAQVQQLAETFRQTLGPDMLAASQALADAATDMGAARAQLEADGGAQAHEAEKQALEKLFAAQRALAQNLAQAQQQLGAEMNSEELAKAAAELAQAMQQLQQGQNNLQQAAQQMGQQAAKNAAEAAQKAAQAAQQAAQAAQAAQQQAQQANNQPAAQSAQEAAQQAQQAAQNAQQAAQAAQQMANQNGQAAAQAAQQAAQQAGQAAQAAQQAAQSAQNAQQAAQQGAENGQQPSQQAGNQQAAQQAGQAAEAAQQAAQAAQTAQQMANAAAQAAQQGGQQASQSMQQAAQQLAQAAMQAAEAGGQLSPSAQQAAQQAAQQLAQAAEQAMNGQNASAQQAAQQAAQQLSQAAGMMAAQQAGISQQQPGGPPMQGQGQQPGQQPGQPGKGKSQQQQASTQPSEGYQPGDPEAVQRAARQAALKKAGFLGLPAREREALQQSLAEKYPEEYGALVEQYLLNLAKEAAKK
jgi:hypothetical protein